MKKKPTLKLGFLNTDGTYDEFSFPNVNKTVNETAILQFGTAFSEIAMTNSTFNYAAYNMDSLVADPTA